MPKRTNPRQQIIAALIKMNEGPGCVVTESKELHDVHNHLDREVDVVVERVIDNETSIWSYEVVAYTRRADVTWVEGRIAKHEYLPTEKLFLVSWSGFTGGARAEAAANPRVLLCTPDIVRDRGEPRIKTIRVGSIQLTPKETRIGFVRPDGTEGWVRSLPDFGLYSLSKEVIGVAKVLIDGIIKDPRVPQLALQGASVHPERNDLRSFDLFSPIVGGFYLHNTDLDELQRITLIEVLGECRFEEKRLDMEVREMRGQSFAHGTVEIAGRDAMLVTRLNEEFDVTAAIARIETTKDTTDDQTSEGKPAEE